MSTRRLTNCVVLALVPCLLVGLHNTGRQANLAIDATAGRVGPGWRGALLDVLGVGLDPGNVWGCLLHGLLWLVPVSAVTLAVGAGWERVFARLRGGQSPGLAVTTLLFTLVLPPTVPLWQAALGISFGVVVGKEIFGGTGKNLLHPALAGFAFLYFAYPDSVRGAPVWAAVDGWRDATTLELASVGGLAAVRDAGIAWLDTVLGLEPGAMGETSALACAAGAAVLLWVRAVSWRILAGGVAGLVFAALVLAQSAPAALPMATLPWHWHLTVGAFAFGLVFFATDPVTAATTNPGRWLYGMSIGVVTVLIRVANPSHVDGAMLAIVLGNVAAPLIDYAVVWRNVRRRERRDA